MDWIVFGIWHVIKYKWRGAWWLGPLITLDKCNALKLATLKFELVQLSTLHPATALLQSAEMLTLYYSLSLQLLLTAGIQALRSFTSACLDPDLSIVSADEITVYNRLAVNVLTRTEALCKLGIHWEPLSEIMKMLLRPRLKCYITDP